MSGPSYKRAEKIGPRLAWLIFQKTATIYCNNKKNKETNNSTILFEIMKKYTSKQKINEKYYSQRNNEDHPPLQEMVNTPSGINAIKPRAIQVWNWN